MAPGETMHISSNTMNRRAFLALAPAAAASRAMASMPLAMIAPAVRRTKMFLIPGGDEYKTCFGADFQAGVQRVWRLLLTHGVTVDVDHCHEARHAGAIFPVFYIYADYLPAALASELQAWQQASPLRSIALTRAEFRTTLDTPEDLAAICRLG
jgi:hypothetical protein